MGDARFLGVVVASGADHQGLAVLRAEIGNRRRRRVGTEINHHVTARNDGREVVALVNLAGDFQFAMLGRAGKERLAHAAARAGDDDARHFNTPQCFKVFFNLSREAALTGTSGRRSSFSIWPSIARAALAGPGFASNEEVLEQRIEFLVQLQRERQVAVRVRANHVGHLAGDDVGGHADHAVRAHRHERQRE